MATPVAHSLAGLAVAALGRRSDSAPALPVLLFAVLAANAPDFDFLPGLLAGDFNRYHQGPSHSLVAAAVFGALSVLARRWLALSAWRAFWLGTLAYGSHLLLDFFCEDGRAPFGLPLLWPVVERHWMSSYTPLGGVRHGVPGDSVWVSLQEIFSMANLYALGKELLLVLPLTLAAWGLARVLGNSRKEELR